MNPGPPTVRELADLTARLRALTRPGWVVDDAERAGFLADKAALLARIPTHPAHDCADQEADPR